MSKRTPKRTPIPGAPKLPDNMFYRVIASNTFGPFLDVEIRQEHTGFRKFLFGSWRRASSGYFVESLQENYATPEEILAALATEAWGEIETKVQVYTAFDVIREYEGDYK